MTGGIAETAFSRQCRQANPANLWPESQRQMGGGASKHCSQNGIAIITFDRKDSFSFQSLKQNNGLRAIVPLSCGDDKAQRVSQRIAYGMDFTAEAAF